jgi:hypothetical protein
LTLLECKYTLEVLQVKAGTRNAKTKPFPFPGGDKELEQDKPSYGHKKKFH